MKLILLPGMDGTGLLFKPLLQFLDGVEAEVISLPSEGPQDYDSISSAIAKRINQQDYVLLAESFSGGIAKALLQDKTHNIRHVIFVASFLSRPSRFRATLASFLPLRLLASIPLVSSFFIRFLLLGRDASAETVELFREALYQVDPKILRARLRYMASIKNSGNSFNSKATYIRPTKDILVSNREAEFRKMFPNLEVIELEGPHFILQSQPEACAKHIKEVVGDLTTTDCGRGAASLHCI
ncbi:hypothetical protein LHL18_11190 [Rheinheimera aquimaris]|nr:hypothetical protein [Rheinheimera aquimaris]MCB5214047.1 hypothetical protein [Rheinheimera aquimaris]